MNRRSFFRQAGSVVLTAVAAPLFIPAERLAFGAPRPKIVVPTELEMVKVFGGETIRGERLVVVRAPFVFDPQAFLVELGPSTSKDYRREEWRNNDSDITPDEMAAINASVTQGGHWQSVTKAVVRDDLAARYAKSVSKYL